MIYLNKSIQKFFIFSMFLEGEVGPRGIKGNTGPSGPPGPSGKCNLLDIS